MFGLGLSRSVGTEGRVGKVGSEVGTEGRERVGVVVELGFVVVVGRGERDAKRAWRRRVEGSFSSSSLSPPGGGDGEGGAFASSSFIRAMMSSADSSLSSGCGGLGPKSSPSWSWSWSRSSSSRVKAETSKVSVAEGWEVYAPMRRSGSTREASARSLSISSSSDLDMVAFWLLPIHCARMSSVPRSIPLPRVVVVSSLWDNPRVSINS